MRFNLITSVQCFALLVLLCTSFQLMAQMMNNSVPPLKELPEIKQLPPSTEKVIQVIRYARNPKMRYSNDLKILLEEALTYTLTIKDNNLIAGALSTRAMVELGLGNGDLAVSFIRQAEAYLPKMGDSYALSLLGDLSRIYNRLGDLEKTITYYDKIEAFCKNKPQFLIQRILNLRNRTNREAQAGNLDKVKSNYQLALKLSSESGNVALLKDTRFSYANVLLNLHQEDDAFAILKELIPDLENTITDRTAQFFEILSRNYEAGGDDKNAFLYAEKEFNLSNATTQQKSSAINRMILLSYLLKNHSNFDAYFASHLKYGMDENNLISKKRYYLAESRYYDVKGKNEQAKKLYRKTLKLKLNNEFSPHEDISALTGLANIFLREGKNDSAAISLKNAENMVKKYPLSASARLIYTIAAKNLHLNTQRSNNELVKNLEQEIHLKDTLYQMHLSKITSELETKYRVNEKEKALELAKKQQELQSLELKQQKQRGWLILISAAIVVLLISSITYIIWQRKAQAALLYDIAVGELQQQHRLAIMNTLTETQEQEKKRVAERLHDEVGALLSIAKLNINTLQNDVYVSGSEFANKMLVTKHLMNNISDTVRNISHSLMPIALEKYGFKAAILDLIAAIQTANHIHVEYLIEGFEQAQNWPTNFTLSTYRIVQEVINNSIKHAQASHLFVQLIELDQAITIYIEDNGKGLSKEDTLKNSVGMTLLKTNIDYLSGTLEMTGRPNEGTFTLIELPVPTLQVT